MRRRRRHVRRLRRLRPAPAPSASASSAGVGTSLASPPSALFSGYEKNSTCVPGHGGMEDGWNFDVLCGINGLMCQRP
ncbi:Os03g0762800 [Oryza sativa Japonica Group]|uniref:Os03g0762800 protein n=3 Tax=Oryza sativa TaxID=4530 RepID=B9F5U5_ORYSJ|nr:hypothetical protein OsI_13640 [Oryza sativa Indica Group]EEE59978.1 hypothetical protein OsJ_12688 [Oryza sativa Japonica Group]KAB8093707.1 hypothetical protein EE612_020618 [Oryza sativa]BAS86526.1 Os03g0762800 [Oryza sativa Japonica Group]